ncbi:hypothetical protein EI555_020095, partial [Monodon monoceros]
CRIENCDSCFSKDFCTKCKVGFYLHRGRCFEECPDGFAPLDETMECKDVRLAIGVSGELVAEIIAHVDLSGVWKPEHGKLLKSQQKTRYHVQRSLNPGDEAERKHFRGIMTEFYSNPRAIHVVIVQKWLRRQNYFVQHRGAKGS